MLGILVYEVADIIYHLGKIGYNCISSGASLFYKKEENDTLYVDKIDLYRKRLEELEERIKSIEKNN